LCMDVVGFVVWFAVQSVCGILKVQGNVKKVYNFLVALDDDIQNTIFEGFLKVLLIFSLWGPLMFRKTARPSSLYKLTLRL